MPSTTPREPRAASRVRASGDYYGVAHLPRVPGYSYERTLELDELAKAHPKDGKPFAVRLRAGLLNPFTHDGDLAVVTPAEPVKSGCTVIASVKGRGLVFGKVSIREDGTLVFIGWNPKKQAPARASAVRWVFRVTSIFQFLA